MSAHGCARRVTVHADTYHAVYVGCGEYYLGELILCEICQAFIAESGGQPPSRVDPADEDAQAEADEERRFMAGDRNGREGP